MGSLFSPIHENIQYSNLSKTQSRDFRRVSNIIKSQKKILAHKTWNSVILEYLLKDTDMEEV